MHQGRCMNIMSQQQAQKLARAADGSVMPAAEVLAVPRTVPAAPLATPASLRADSEALELIALDPRRRQKFKLASKEVCGGASKLMRPPFLRLPGCTQLGWRLM